MAPKANPTFQNNWKIVQYVANVYKKKKKPIPWLGDKNYKQTTYYKRVHKMQDMVRKGKSMAEAKAWLQKQLK